MGKRNRMLAAIGLALGLVCGQSAQAQAKPIPVAVAAAGDLRGVLEELKTAFERSNPGAQLQISYGASGSQTAQILQGAPFDVFLAADMGFPEQLQKGGLVSQEGPFPYATGRLTLWVRKDLGLDPAKDGLNLLLDPRILKVATANPVIAPYGRAGEAALRKAGLYDGIKAKLVFADNIAQAAQFLQAGAAEAGLISHAQASNPALLQAGSLWTVPAGLYPPLRQGGVILARSTSAEPARSFRGFLLGAKGQAILARHGFSKP